MAFWIWVKKKTGPRSSHFIRSEHELVISGYHKAFTSECVFTILLTNSSLRLHETYTAWKVFVFGAFLVRIFPHSDWIRRDKYLSVFSPNAGKYGPESLRIRTLFLQWYLWPYETSMNGDFLRKNVKRFQPVTLFAKISIKGVW